MAPDLKKKGSPTSKKAAQVARVGTGRGRVYQGRKHQPVTPGTRTTHGVRSERPKETCCPRASGRCWGSALGGRAEQRAGPLGRAASWRTEPHREIHAQEKRAKARTQGKGGQGSGTQHKCGAASESKKPNTQSIGQLGQPHYN